MAIIKNIETIFSDIDNGGVYAKAYPVDDEGGKVELCKLVALKGNGKSELGYPNRAGNVGATIVLADNTNEALLPQGIVYQTSPKDPYAGRDIEEQRYKYPIGENRETTGLVLLEKCGIIEVDDTDARKSTRKAYAVEISGTWSVDTGVDDTLVTGTSGAATTELEVGDWVIVEDEVRQVASITDANNFVVTKAFTKDHTSVKVIRDTDIGKPVYLTTNGDYSRIKPTTGKAIVVGKITGANRVLIDLKHKNLFDELN